ncbi:MAG: hypothetical protein ACR2PZ_22095 [Pseudomonadales bacterium]
MSLSTTKKLEAVIAELDDVRHCKGIAERFVRACEHYSSAGESISHDRPCKVAISTYVDTFTWADLKQIEGKHQWCSDAQRALAEETVALESELYQSRGRRVFKLQEVFVRRFTSNWEVSKALG